MEQRLEPLFTPWKIGNCEIKNRIVLDVYKRQVSYHFRMQV